MDGETKLTELYYGAASTLREIQRAAHNLAKEKGWYEGGDRNIPESLALIHSEVSEALEDFRRHRMQPDEKLDSIGIRKPIGFPSELADIVIRVADLAEYLQIDLGEAVAKKHAYNMTRPYRHGGKKA